MTKKKKIRLWIVILFMLICLTGTVYYSYKIIIWKMNVEENTSIQKKLDKHIIVDKKDKEKPYRVDFKELQSRNPDTIAYIQVNGTNIHYVVVKGTNNSFYLSHNFDKKWNLAGWVFADYHNKFDESDKNIIIYAHNMKDGSMFETLKNTLNKEWYSNKKNHIVTLVTVKGIYKYQVFSTYSIEPEDYYINTSFNDDNEFLKFLDTLKNRSVYNYDVSLSINDKILTLSSCLGDGSKRVVLHAKLIKE